MKKLISNLFVLLVLMVAFLSCEESPVIVEPTDLEEVRIAVVLPQKDRQTIWKNSLNWVAENIQKANIGVKVVYEWYDEENVNLTDLGKTLSEREDIKSIIGCNISANTQELAFALARKKENIKPLFTFSTSQELPRIFGHRGFLWGLCETDISQSEILLSSLSFEFDDIKKVALLASEDIYGQTFVDWFAFQAVELEMQPVCVLTYKNAHELQSRLEEITQSGTDALVCVPAAVNDVLT
ncbi:MAG: hypothetical protein II287_00860, partial [Bacteroidaceae bacterium]|nr:hypothetical protein [Bacteroidaceae bacterium]